jgi:hypothetical protein
MPLTKKDGLGAIAGEAATWGTPALGGPVGMAAAVAKRVASPTSTASQAQENTAMGRSPSAGPFSAHADEGALPPGTPVSSTPAPVLPQPTHTAPSGLNTGIDDAVGVRDLARIAGAR